LGKFAPICHAYVINQSIKETFMPKKPYLFVKIICLLTIFTLYVGCVRQAIIPYDPSIQKVLFSISNTLSETDILNGIAQIDLAAPGSYYTARAALILKKPSYLRLELLGPMGPPDFFLAATPQKMEIIIPAKAEFYQGAPTGSNLSRFLPWQFDIQDIVAIFACSYPPLTGEVDYLKHEEGNTLKIEMKARGGISQYVWIGRDGRLEKLERFDENGRALYRAEFADYSAGSSRAGRISVSTADSMTSVTVKFSDLKIEKARDLSIFDLPTPTGFKIITMD
jgi:hypothetical protein